MTMTSWEARRETTMNKPDRPSPNGRRWTGRPVIERSSGQQPDRANSGRLADEAVNERNERASEAGSSERQ
jgi:hypothetical protein